MRILIRTSKWAIWARRFGSLALPLVVVPVLLHREQLISSSDFMVVEAVAIAVAVLAVLLALGAYGRLWVTGDQGWSKASWGLMLGVICLLPFAWFGYQAWRHPMVSAVSTDFIDPPRLVSAKPGPQSLDDRRTIEAAFPNARSRSYPIEATQMFTVVEDLARAQGWEIRTARAPTSALDMGTLTAVDATLFGWRDEVAMRVRGSNQGATIDMRSAPLHAGPDFGSNGQRIEAFLVELDSRITLMLRDAPVSPTTGVLDERG
ncbi:DUF1499 domain-containing protein [Devosia sp.]|uniref:DUF1499 domain-containing protein n=1 Tax=Devosia sp. TaxID=1871048 RepID=UPI003A94CD9A